MVCCRRWLVLGALTLASTTSVAQESESFRIDGSTLNAGGRPDDGVVASSETFRVSLDALGHTAQILGLESMSYSSDGGFVATYPPPGEVRALRFLDEETLTWDADPSTGSYQLYRDLVSTLISGAYGSCVETGLLTNVTADPERSPPGEGFFYLVTASNRLSEEGPKGDDSSGSARDGSTCP